MNVDWKSLTMKFRVGGMVVTLQGDPSLSKTMVSLKAMMKALKGSGEGMLLELGAISAEFEEKQWEIPRMLLGVLEEFEGVFFDPEGLPQYRKKDHAINLILGTAPVHVRPYRYPYM